MNKKILAVFLTIFLIITAIGIIALIDNKNYFNPKSKSEIFTNQVKTKILTYSKKESLSNRIDSLLNKINDSRLDDKTRYQQLVNLAFYFTAEYSVSHDPSLRIFTSETIGNFAKSNFPKYFQANDFNILCADPSCGNKLDSKANEIINSISNNKQIDKFYINIILKNLKNALYIPDDYLSDKKIGFNLAISQLQELNNPQASKSAEDLKNYFYGKYKIKL